MGDYKTVSSVNGDLNIAFGLTIACLRDLTATSANNSGPTSYSAMYCCPAAPNQRTGTGTAGAGYVKYRNACLENVVDRMLTTASIAIHIAGIGLLISSRLPADLRLKLQMLLQNYMEQLLPLELIRLVQLR